MFRNVTCVLFGWYRILVGVFNLGLVSTFVLMNPCDYKEHLGGSRTTSIG